uniref:Fibronectin type-III domain-containing protein n=1 Tax=Vannella robusta TaxID=1487602 RepID=A0A7S4IR61_9EUKA
MAVQMQVAFSSIMRGAGIFAGGPYNCAQGKLNEALGSCMKAKPAPDVQSSISATESRAQDGSIDDPSNLASQKIFMFSGTQDTTVYPQVMEALYEYYNNYVSKSNIYFDNTVDAAHTQPTTNPQMNSCTRSYSPYVSYCEYDGAGNALSQIYGVLNPRNNGTLTGQMLEFDQSEFLSNPASKSIADTGYVYIPDSCMKNESCVLHIALHGCLQNYGSVNNEYIDNSGYNEWADTNNIVILYPQTIVSNVSPSNPNACWNWWGYNNNPSSYDTKSGYQMNMVYEMIQRMTSGLVTIPAPTNLVATSVTETSVSLQWSPVTGATGYYVQRDGATLNSVAVSTTSFTDSSVASGSSYEYTVTATDGQSISPPSSAVSVQTPGNPPPLSAPQNLQVTGVTATSVSLSWSAVSGADGYNVYRYDMKVNTDTVVGTSYADEGLQSLTRYVYDVTAVRGDEESSPSNVVEANTESSYVCTTTTASNYAHVQAGRAFVSVGKAFAVGSEQDMGLYNTAIITTLSETSPSYYVIGDCDQ